MNHLGCGCCREGSLQHAPIGPPVAAQGPALLGEPWTFPSGTLIPLPTAVVHNTHLCIHVYR